MSFLYLTEADVEQVLDMPLAIELVEEAFRRLAAGEAHNVPRVRARAPGVVLHSMSAAAEYLGRVGWKQYSTTRQGARFYVGLHDSTDGNLLAVIEANRLGQMRTGAATGLAIKLLADPQAVSLGLFGAGWQAQSQLAAAAAVRPLQRALVFSPNAKHCRAFVARMTQQYPFEIGMVEKPRDAASGLPLVITATTSRVPVFDGAWLAPGALVCAIGSNWAEKMEIDIETIRAAERIVCDSVECCRQEAGDLIAAADKGAFHWSQAIELSNVAAGKLPGRISADGIVLFKSVGMAIEDVAVAGRVFDLAQERGLGREVPG
jgi:ornithine cyclodeaminase/alanine dehydrogenase-like protein (mu-crystallin family)